MWPPPTPGPSSTSRRRTFRAVDLSSGSASRPRAVRARLEGDGGDDRQCLRVPLSGVQPGPPSAGRQTHLDACRSADLQRLRRARPPSALKGSLRVSLARAASRLQASSRGAERGSRNGSMWSRSQAGPDRRSAMTWTLSSTRPTACPQSASLSSPRASSHMCTCQTLAATDGTFAITFMS